MSRLDFAPDTDAMEVTDIATGHFVFAPRPGKEVSIEKLRGAIEGAGYEVERADIEVAGTLREDARLLDPDSRQTFALTGERIELLMAEIDPGDSVVVRGAWTVDDGVETIEIDSWSRPEGQ